MVLSLETAMSSGLVFYTILVQCVYGTFPPVNNPPPIPSQGMRILDNSPQGYFVQEELPQDFSSPLGREEGLFPPETRPDEQRWFLRENQSGETGQVQRSTDTFDRYYQSGEPAIGPVATPIPDDSYIAQSSSVSRLNPNDPGNSDVWILARGSDNQYIPERWVQIQVPADRFVEVVNQDSGPPPVATDTVKSIVQPEVSVKTPFTANTPSNIVQQVWIRAPSKTAGSQVYGNPPAFVQDVPSAKQLVDIPPANGKQIVQQKVFSDIPPINIPAPAPLISKKPFSVPPPLPPPLKGDTSAKSISSVNVIPDSNVIVGGKNGIYQRLRHVWIPTSSKTGKFISFPVSPTIDSDKSIIGPRLTLDSTPVTVSDTWVLKQDGPIPAFQQQKSPLPPPVVQNDKVIIQDPPIIQVNNLPSPKIIAQVNSPKNPTGKSVDFNPPVSIWPVAQDVSSKEIGKSAPISPVPVSVIKSSGGINKWFPQTPLIKSPVPPPLPPTSVQIINDKPCPIPPPVPQKSLFPPRGPSVISLPRVIGTQRLPLTRIVRVNRYPTGSYYLLNTRVRPNYNTYPSTAIIQQSKNGIIRLVQPNQTPFQFQTKQPIITPVQTKQIAIPVQSKSLAPPIPARQVLFPFATRQAILPLSPKSTRIIYPTLQVIRYPWGGLANYRPVPGKGIFKPLLAPLKASPGSSSESSSSENSSESSSSESEEKKEEKSKKEEKPKKEEKLKIEEKKDSEESESSSEKEKESSEKESEESPAESKSEEESIEAAESQNSHVPANIAYMEHHLTEADIHHISRIGNYEHLSTILHQGLHDTDGRVTAPYGHVAEPRTVSHEGSYTNFIPSHLSKKEDKTHHGLEGSTDVMTTDIARD